MRPADTGDEPCVHPQAEFLYFLAPLSAPLVVPQFLAGRHQTTARPGRWRQVLVLAAERRRRRLVEAPHPLLDVAFHSGDSCHPLDTRPALMRLAGFMC